MGFKKFIKRVNRGIILAVLTITALVIYLVVDDYMFKQNISDISDTLEAYLADLADAAVTPEGDVNADKTGVTAEGAADFFRRYAAVINKYVTEAPNTDSVFSGLYYREKSAMLDFKTDRNESYISRWDYRLQNVVIRKLGPNMASAEFQVEVIAEANGKAKVLPFIDRLENFDNFGLIQEIRYKMNGYYTAKMKKVGGEWLFYGISGGGHTEEEFISGQEYAEEDWDSDWGNWNGDWDAWAELPGLHSR